MIEVRLEELTREHRVEGISASGVVLMMMIIVSTRAREGPGRDSL